MPFTKICDPLEDRKQVRQDVIHKGLLGGWIFKFCVCLRIAEDGIGKNEKDWGVVRVVISQTLWYNIQLQRGFLIEITNMTL